MRRGRPTPGEAPRRKSTPGPGGGPPAEGSPAGDARRARVASPPGGRRRAPPTSSSATSKEGAIPAVEDGLIPANPVAAVKRPRIHRREAHWPTSAQLAALVRASQGTVWEIPILLAAVTGRAGRRSSGSPGRTSISNRARSSSAVGVSSAAFTLRDYRQDSCGGAGSATSSGSHEGFAHGCTRFA